MLLVGIFIIRVEKTYFLSNFCMGLASFDDLLWMFGPSLQENVFLVTKKFVTKSPVFRHYEPLVTKLDF